MSRLIPLIFSMLFTFLLTKNLSETLFVGAFAASIISFVEKRKTRLNSRALPVELQSEVISLNRKRWGVTLSLIFGTSGILFLFAFLSAHSNWGQELIGYAPLLCIGCML